MITDYFAMKSITLCLLVTIKSMLTDYFMITEKVIDY